MKTKYALTTVLFGLLLTGVSIAQPVYTADQERAARSIQAEEVRKHIDFLASDDLLGRATPSPGLDSAAVYLDRVFRRQGLEPAGNAGSFLLPYPVRFARVDGSRAALTFERDGASQSARWLDDFVVLLGAERPMEGTAVYLRSVKDLARLSDAQARSIIMLDDPAFHFESEMIDFSMRMQPEGIIVVMPSEVPREAFKQMASMFAERLVLETNLLGNAKWLMMPSDAASRLMHTAGLNLDSLRQTNLENGFIELKGTTVRKNTPYQEEVTLAPNVVGILPGSDPDLRNTYVVLTAHYDHVGGMAGTEGDQINNGADDNASGTAALLEVARAFAGIGARPARSIAFVAVSGEELGMVGSDYFADHLPLDGKVVANINLDMVGRNAPDTLFSLGQPFTSLGPVATTVASRPDVAFHLVESDDPSLFYRSDQVGFIRHGIPALFFTSGLHAQYHTPDDEVEHIDSDKIARVARLAFYTALAAAVDGTSPSWTPTGMEFRQKYGW